MKVLAVDDEEMNTRALKRALSSKHEVRTAHSIDEALAALAEEPPDVLLCDFDLGQGQTSTPLFREVTTRWPGVRRVLYSASRPEQWGELVSERLIDAAIAKPCSLEELNKALTA